jgi:hypothetical protein
MLGQHTSHGKQQEYNNLLASQIMVSMVKSSITHACSGTTHCCPVRALVRYIIHIKQHNESSMIIPMASYLLSQQPQKSRQIPGHHIIVASNHTPHWPCRCEASAKTILCQPAHFVLTVPRHSCAHRPITISPSSSAAGNPDRHHAVIPPCPSLSCHGQTLPPKCSNTAPMSQH